MKIFYVLTVWLFSCGFIKAQQTQISRFGAFHHAFAVGHKGDDEITLKIGSLPSSSPVYIGFGDGYKEAEQRIGAGSTINKEIGDAISGARISSINNDPSTGLLTISIHWWYNVIPGSRSYALIVWLGDAEAQNVLKFPILDSYLELDDNKGLDGIACLVPVDYRPEGYASIKRNQLPNLIGFPRITFSKPK